MRTLIILLLPMFVIGCQTYSHKRTEVRADGTRVVEYTRTRGVAIDAEAAKIQAKTEDGDYSRSVGFEDLSTLSDEEVVKQITEAVAEVGENVIKAVTTP